MNALLDPGQAIIVSFTVLDQTLQGAQRCNTFATLAECSAWFAEQRDAGCYGASELGQDKLILPDGHELRISYNGRIWDGDVLVYDPRTGETIAEYAVAPRCSGCSGPLHPDRICPNRPDMPDDDGWGDASDSSAGGRGW